MGHSLDGLTPPVHLLLHAFEPFCASWTWPATASETDGDGEQVPQRSSPDWTVWPVE